MRRYQYRLNDQNISQAGWGLVTPLKYIETVPGETYGGTISVNAGTQLTSKMIKSRAYYDLYAFYVPIRLLWDDFPQFLAGSEGDLQPPQTSTLFPQNFENDFVGQDGNGNTNSAFLRRAYWLIHMTFFSGHKGADGKRYSDDGNRVRAGEFDTAEAYAKLQPAKARSSTLDESWLVGDSVESQKIIGVGDQEGRFTEISLDQIRRAYALDRWEKMKDYYGTRYTDVLKGYGVKADWGMLQEPECIGISNNDFGFKPRSSSGDTNFGDRKGFFEGEYKLKLKKTFTPEHGIIAVMAVARTDTFNQIRRAYALDRWEKMKDYYGTRYTDVLKGYGVKADWGMLQEPECIGISNNDFGFKPRSSSGDTNFGDRKGFFEGEYKLKLKKTFTPEHGIIAVMAVARTDTFNQTQGAHTLCTRDLKSPTTWWDPISASAYNDQTMPAMLLDSAADGNVRIPLHEYLRKGRNEMALPYDAAWTEVPVISKSMSANVADHNTWLQQACTPGAADFDDDADVTHYSEVRISKRSPVKPAVTTTLR